MLFIPSPYMHLKNELDQFAEDTPNDKNGEYEQAK